MSCPHPRTPVERIVGEFSEIVCPDCHERLAAAVDEPFSPEDLFCAYETEDGFCALDPGHLEDHLLVPYAKVDDEDDAEVLPGGGREASNADAEEGANTLGVNSENTPDLPNERKSA